MSLEYDSQGFDVDGLVPAHVQALLKGFPDGITKPAYQAIAPLVGEGMLLELLDTYTGDYGFVQFWRDQVRKNAMDIDGTCYLMVNVLRLVVRGEPVKEVLELTRLLDKRVSDLKPTTIRDFTRTVDPATPAPSRLTKDFTVKFETPEPGATIRFLEPDEEPKRAPAPRAAPVILATVVDAVKEPRATKYYACTTCKAQIEGLVPLYLHHINVHNGKWAFPKLTHLPMIREPGSSVYFVEGYTEEFQRVHGRWPFFAHPPTPPASPTYDPAGTPPRRTAGTVSSTFTPKYDIDLRGIPDGRFAVQSSVTGAWLYLIKTTRKYKAHRYGRFRWGRTTHRGEYVAPGTIEIRLQAGDTKKLVGEQRVGEAVYTGDYEDEIKNLMRDPVEAMQEYGRKTKKCAYCGRSLTDEISLARGVGPDCWGAHHLTFASRFDAGKVTS